MPNELEALGFEGAYTKGNMTVYGYNDEYCLEVHGFMTFYNISKETLLRLIGKYEKTPS